MLVIQSRKDQENEMILHMIDALNPKIINDLNFVSCNCSDVTINEGLIFKGNCNWNFVLCDDKRIFYSIAKNNDSGVQSHVFGGIEYTYNHFKSNPDEFIKS